MKELERLSKKLPSLDEFIVPLFNYEDDKEDIKIFISKSGWLKISIKNKFITTKLDLNNNFSSRLKDFMRVK